MKIGLVIPTVAGRAEYLERCLRGYEGRHETGHEVVPVVVHDRWSGGIAWQEGAEMARELGCDYLHLTNDDIVPGLDYLRPMIESVLRGEVPVVLVVIPVAETLDADKMPLPGNPTTGHASHFEGTEMIQITGTHANGESEYPSLPFCSMQQWDTIGPMIPSQYGTDKWFGHRAKLAGIPNVCVSATFYHYAAGVGRDGMIEGWLGQDRLAFDHNIAYPMYVNGGLPLDQLHPEAKTARGRQMARDWYQRHVGQIYWRNG
jgi:hypothetical protein